MLELTLLEIAFKSFEYGCCFYGNAFEQTKKSLSICWAHCHEWAIKLNDRRCFWNLHTCNHAQWSLLHFIYQQKCLHSKVFCWFGCARTPLWTFKITLLKFSNWIFFELKWIFDSKLHKYASNQGDKNELSSKCWEIFHLYCIENE